MTSFMNSPQLGKGWPHEEKNNRRTNIAFLIQTFWYFCHFLQWYYKTWDKISLPCVFFSHNNFICLNNEYYLHSVLPSKNIKIYFPNGGKYPFCHLFLVRFNFASGNFPYALIVSKVWKISSASFSQVVENTQTSWCKSDAKCSKFVCVCKQAM